MATCESCVLLAIEANLAQQGLLIRLGRLIFYDSFNKVYRYNLVFVIIQYCHGSRLLIYRHILKLQRILGLLDDLSIIKLSSKLYIFFVGLWASPEASASFYCPSTFDLFLISYGRMWSNLNAAIAFHIN